MRGYQPQWNKNRKAWKPEEEQKLWKLAKAGASLEEVYEEFKYMPEQRVNDKLFRMGFSRAGGKVSEG